MSPLQGQATSWQDLVDQINNPASSPEPTYTPEEQAAIDAAQAAANAAYEAQVAAFWAEMDAALVSPAPLSTSDAQAYQAAQFGWPMDYTDSDGRLHALVGVESNGLPSYQTPRMPLPRKRFAPTVCCPAAGRGSTSRALAARFINGTKVACVRPIANSSIGC